MKLKFLTQSLDTFGLSSVHSARMKQILMKGAHYKLMLRSIPLIISPVFAGTLPFRSAPIDR